MNTNTVNTPKLTLLLSAIILLTTISHYACNSDAPVTGRCGRPGVPANAKLWLISPERSRFDNKEKVIVHCKNDEFPQYKQQLECHNGRWVGGPARCGKHINAQVTQMDIFDCQTAHKRLLLLQPINTTWETPLDIPLRANSFHSSRLPNEIQVSANGSTCYTWLLRLDRKVAVAFLLIDIWYPALNGSDTAPTPPTVTPEVSRHRSCSLQKQQIQIIDRDVVVGYYYYCDLNVDVQPGQSDLTDMILVRVNTSTKHEVGLEALFLGGHYTTSIVGSKVERPDCGQLSVKNVGVNMQIEINHAYISCNDSFVDISDNKNGNGKYSMTSGNPKHLFKCNANGQWEGSWPLCSPKIICSNDEIYDRMDSSVIIEEIGNVYYMNDTQWYAMNDSWIRYTCAESDGIMVGKNFRTCMKNGTWSGKSPHCATSGISVLTIWCIVMALLVAFMAIVVLLTKYYGKLGTKSGTSTDDILSMK